MNDDLEVYSLDVILKMIDDELDPNISVVQETMRDATRMFYAQMIPDIVDDGAGLSEAV